MGERMANDAAMFSMRELGIDGLLSCYCILEQEIQYLLDSLFPLRYEDFTTQVALPLELLLLVRTKKRAVEKSEAYPTTAALETASG